MGYYDNDGVWVEGEAMQAPTPRRMPRQMRPASERQNDPNVGVRRQARRELRQGHYDNDGNWVEGAAANTQETMEDVGASFTGGIQRGVAQLAGMGGDMREMQLASNRAAVRGLAGLFGREVSDDDVETIARLAQLPTVAVAPYSTPTAPTSQQTNATMQTVFGEQHEPETTAGEYARTVGEFLPGALIPATRGQSAAQAATRTLAQRAAAAAPQAARQVTTQAVAPALASEAAGQLTEGMGPEVETTARILAALGAAGVSEGTISILSRQGLTPDERALRLIRRELADAGFSAEEITRAANRLLQQAPTEEVLGELMGPSGQRLMRATAAMGRGAGRSQADAVLEARAVGRDGPARSADPNRRGVSSISDRVMGEAARHLSPSQPGSPNSYWDMLDTLRQSRASQGAENYALAYAQQIDQGLANQHLLPIMREAPDAARSGARQLDTEVQRLIGERSQLGLRGNPSADDVARIEAQIEDARQAAAQLRAIAEGQTPPAVNVRAIDYFQRGIAQAERGAGMGSPEASALGQLRRGFNGLADQIAPGLGDTRAQYGRSMSIEEFSTLGRRIFEMSDGELERALRGPGGRQLTTEEFDSFQLGVLDAVENKLGQGDTGFLARLARNANWRALLERATGSPANARRFMNRLAREANMQRTRNFVQSGSRTQPLSEDIRALTEGESELAFMADAGNINGFVTRIASGAKNPMDAGVRLWAWIYDRTQRPGIANPKVQQAMASRLFARVSKESSRELRDALMAAPDNSALNPQLRAFIQSVLAAQGEMRPSEAPER